MDVNARDVCTHPHTVTHFPSRTHQPQYGSFMATQDWQSVFRWQAWTGTLMICTHKTGFYCEGLVGASKQTMNLRQTEILWFKTEDVEDLLLANISIQITVRLDFLYFSEGSGPARCFNPVQQHLKYAELSTSSSCFLCIHGRSDNCRWITLILKQT